MLERYFIEHCSPTLASLKTASLFTYICNSRLRPDTPGTGLEPFFSGERSVAGGVGAGGRGERCCMFTANRASTMICVPRGWRGFFPAMGYDDIHKADAALERLKDRLSDSEVFPHEIGVFLGYPLGDVIGFIQNAGQNCKCTGCWKVYCNECEAVRLFEKYQKCRDVYLRLWNQGKSVLQLTVAA